MAEFNRHVQSNYSQFDDKKFALFQNVTPDSNLLHALLNDSTLRKNMILMSFIWSFTSTSYYIVNFYLKYLKGNLFFNTEVAVAAEAVSQIAGGYLYIKLGLKKSYFICYLVAVAGATLIMCFETKYVSLVPLFVLLTKAGIGAVFGVLYLGNNIFPVTYASQTIGVCNILARICTILAPLIAELKPPAPMVVVAILAALAGII